MPDEEDTKNEFNPTVVYTLYNWDRIQEDILAKNPGIDRYSLLRKTKEVALEAWNSEPQAVKDEYARVVIPESWDSMTEEECMTCIGDQLAAK